MKEQVENGAALSGLLEAHRDDLVSAWTSMIQTLHDATPPRGLASQTASLACLGIDALIDLLKTGSPQALDTFTDDLERQVQEATLDRSVAVEYLLLLKSATLPFVLQAGSASSSKAFELVEEIDAAVQAIVRHFNQRRLRRESLLRTDQGSPEYSTTAGESLQRITTALLQGVFGLDEALETVCTEARRLTGASGSAVLLLEDEGWLRVMNSSGTPSPALELLPAGDSFAGRVIAEGKPLLLNEPNSRIQAYYRNPDLQSLLATPLRAKNKTIGAIDVVNKAGGFSSHDIQIMSLFADQAAIAIENARLHEQSEQLAVIKERQRLARELHDSVTQTLYSVKLYADASRLALSAGQAQTVAENLEELSNLAREAMLDMRMLIFELHPPKLADEGLASALQARLETVEARSGLQIEFYVEGERQMPLLLEEELYRITQEALNNVVKHAQARKVVVNLRYEEDHFVLEVLDDGIGLEPAMAGKRGGLGLRSIRERVQRIGGNLSLVSEADQGTRLRVEVEY